MTSNSKEPETSLQNLQDYVSRILAADAGECDQNLLRTIKRRLKQYRLLETLAAEDVLHEAFIRTQNAIVQRGTSIENIPAWLNRVSLNVIREESRQLKSNQKIYQAIQISLNASNSFLESETFIERHAHHVSQISLVWDSLSDSERSVLELRFIKSYSWQIIASQLSQSEAKSISAATARKRGERVLTKLKSVFSKGVVDQL